MLLDALLWFWVHVGIGVAKVVAPGRAAELENLRSILSKPNQIAGEQETPQVAEVSKAEMLPGTINDKAKSPSAASCPMRITSDLIQADQDPAQKSSSAMHSHGVPSSSLEATTPTPASAIEEFRELQIRMEDLKASTPDMRNLLGLLLRSNEDNAVLKSALQTTLAKLQAARDELHFTRAELQVSQEQAHLLLEERESVCFSQADDSGEGCGGMDTEADVIVKRSLDALLASLETSFLNGESSSTPSSVGWAQHTALSPSCSFELEASQQRESSELSLSNSPLLSPRSNLGSNLGTAAASQGGKQPTVHLKGVGYRMSFASANVHDQ